MHIDVKCTYDVYYETVRFVIQSNDIYKNFSEKIKKNIFIPIRKSLESKIGAVLNAKSKSEAVRYIAGLHLKNKELTFDFVMRYRYNHDEYKITEHEDHLEVINTYDARGNKKYKSYKIKGEVCSCMSYRIGNSKFGKHNCKHMEMIRKAPVELKGL